MSGKILKGKSPMNQTIYKLETEKARYTVTEAGRFGLWFVSRTLRYITYEQREQHRRHHKTASGAGLAPGEEVHILRVKDEREVIDYLTQRLKEEHPPREWQPRTKGIP